MTWLSLVMWFRTFLGMLLPYPLTHACDRKHSSDAKRDLVHEDTRRDGGVHSREEKPPPLDQDSNMGRVFISLPVNDGKRYLLLWTFISSGRKQNHRLRF